MNSILRSGQEAPDFEARALLTELCRKFAARNPTEAEIEALADGARVVISELTRQLVKQSRRASFIKPRLTSVGQVIDEACERVPIVGRTER